MTKSSKWPPDNRLNTPFFCNIFPRMYISMVPAGPEEDEGSCYWMPDQHIARSGLPHSPQMRRCGMSQKTAAAKPHFLHPAAEERAAWLRAPTEPHHCNASNKKYTRQRTAQKSRSCSCPAISLPRSLPAGASRPGNGARTVLPEAACAAPQVPATDATRHSNWFSHRHRVKAEPRHQSSSLKLQFLARESTGLLCIGVFY